MRIGLDIFIINLPYGCKRIYYQL